MKYLFSFLLIIILLFQTNINGQLAVGDTAINFTLPDTAGNSIRLQDYSGDVILLNFFATWCVPCSIEAPQLQDSIWNIYKYQDFTLIGLDFQEPLSPLLSFINYYNLTFPIVRDTAGMVFNDYGLIVLPSNVLINQNGIVIWSEPGFDIPVMKGLIDSLLQITSAPVEKSKNVTSQIELISTFPNPFNSQTAIKLRVKHPVIGTLRVYDSLGSLLKTKKQNLYSGYNTVRVDMTDYSSGIYFYSIVVDEKIIAGKFLLYK